MGCNNSRPKSEHASAGNGGAGAKLIPASKAGAKVETPQGEPKHLSVNQRKNLSKAADPPLRDKNGDIRDVGSRPGPIKTSGYGEGVDNQSGTTATSYQELDEDGNPVVLPKGDWVKTEGTPFYYSEKENLYFHPPSCQFYDPTNEMWYDPEKDEWYHDDDNDA